MLNIESSLRIFLFYLRLNKSPKSLHIDSERELARLNKVLKALVFSDNKIISCDSPILLALIKCSVRFRLGPTNNPSGGLTMLVSKNRQNQTRFPDIFK